MKILTLRLLFPVLAALFSLTLLSGCGPDAPTGPAAENLAKGKAFMEQNAKKEGVITLENGIQYKVIVSGSGKMPKITDIALIHHRGMHIDGTEFSNSHKEGKGEPEENLVKYTIPGWKKILPNMAVGSKWMVYLPPHMAFSNRGAEGYVEPNETLIYEIELVGIKW